MRFGSKYFFFFLEYGRFQDWLRERLFRPLTQLSVIVFLIHTVGKVMGLIVSSWSLALIFGVPLGSFIGGVLHWRWTFWIFTLMGVFVVLLILLEMRRHAQHKNSGKEEIEEPQQEHSGCAESPSCTCLYHDNLL